MEHYFNARKESLESVVGAVSLSCVIDDFQNQGRYSVCVHPRFSGPLTKKQKDFKLAVSLSLSDPIKRIPLKERLRDQHFMVTMPGRHVGKTAALRSISNENPIKPIIHHTQKAFLKTLQTDSKIYFRGAPRDNAVRGWSSCPDDPWLGPEDFDFMDSMEEILSRVEDDERYTLSRALRGISF